MLASVCSTRSQQSTAGAAVGRGFDWNSLIRRGIYFARGRHRGAAEGRGMGVAGAAGIGIADSVPGPWGASSDCNQIYTQISIIFELLL
jgi:hypothetical protein